MLFNPSSHRDTFNAFTNRADPDQAALVRAALSGTTHVWLCKYIWSYNSGPNRSFLFYVSTWMFIYITFHSEWGLAWIFMIENGYMKDADTKNCLTLFLFVSIDICFRCSMRRDISFECPQCMFCFRNMKINFWLCTCIWKLERVINSLYYNFAWFQRPNIILCMLWVHLLLEYTTTKAQTTMFTQTDHLPCYSDPQ